MASKAKHEEFVTEGAKDLRAWLDKHGISVPDFCEQHDLDRVEVQRCMNGERQRITVNFAKDIELATRGDVKIVRWAHSDAVMRRLTERRSKVRRAATKRRAA
jgi:hypothetical protein